MLSMRVFTFSKHCYREYCCYKPKHHHTLTFWSYPTHLFKYTNSNLLQHLLVESSYEYLDMSPSNCATKIEKTKQFMGKLIQNIHACETVHYAE